MSQDISPSTGSRRAELLAEVGELSRTSQNAVDEVDEAFCELLGINRNDGRCLDIVERLGRITAGRLAEESGLTTGAVTGIVDRLERAGYLRRVRDDADRRKVLVELTPRARRLTDETYVAFHRDSFGLLERFGDAELEAIVEFLRLGRDRNRGFAEDLRERARRRRRPR
jgi:DNA-binding MarR family transcriptional regulator